MPTETDLTGRRVSSGSVYTLGRQLGDGGFGAVYHATRDVALTGQHFAWDVVLKVLPPNGRSSFLAFEAAALAVARCPQLVPLLDVFEWQGRVLLVSEYVKGHDLARVIRHHRKLGRGLDDGLVARVGLELSRALRWAHDPIRGLVHGDIKPSTILLAPDGAVRLSDFALGIPFEGPGSEGIGRRATAGYVAPEVLRYNSTGKGACDIYALGVTLWELSSGLAVPHSGTLLDDRPVLERWRASRPPRHALDAVIARMLNIDPEARPTAAECVEAFRPLAEAAAAPGEARRSAAMRLVATATAGINAEEPPPTAPIPRPRPDPAPLVLTTPAPAPAAPPAPAPRQESHLWIWVFALGLSALLSLGFLVGRTIEEADSGGARALPEPAPTAMVPVAPPAEPVVAPQEPVAPPPVAAPAVLVASSPAPDAPPVATRPAQIVLEGPVRKATAAHRGVGSKVDLQTGATPLATGAWRLLIKSVDSAGQIVSTTLDVSLRGGQTVTVRCDPLSGACKAGSARP